MNKALTLAALLGLATSKSVSSMMDSGNVVSHKYFTLDWSYELDFGYGTHYGGMQFDDSQSMAPHAEAYGSNIYSYATFTVDASAGDFYEWTGALTFEPFYIVPYQQTVMWSRPEANDGNMFSLVGSRHIELLQVYTEFTENHKTFEVSLWDYFNNDRADAYPAESEW
jgi:hypothetical protein